MPLILGQWQQQNTYQESFKQSQIYYSWEKMEIWESPRNRPPLFQWSELIRLGLCEEEITWCTQKARENGISPQQAAPFCFSDHWRIHFGKQQHISQPVCAEDCWKKSGRKYVESQVMLRQNHWVLHADSQRYRDVTVAYPGSLQVENW